MKEKRIKAWAIVNNRFEDHVVNHPHLWIADVFGDEIRAKGELEKLHPKFCEGCGRENKPVERHVKVIPIEIIYKTK